MQYTRNSIALVLLFSVLTVIAFPSPTRADETTTARLEFFEKRIRPLLVDQCIDCHGEDSAESNLRLDSLAAMLKGGLRGPAIVPGKPEASLLVRAMRHSERLQMPPKRKLSTAEISAFATWIQDGAAWTDAEVPDSPGSAPTSGEFRFSEEQRSFWAFQVPTDSPVPAVRTVDWITSPIDAFVLDRLEQAGLSPAPPADRRRLIRRVTFDLIGLPPTPAEVDAYLADDSPHAFARVVDRLLASPHYGERWGRHWLDVARYADSNGLDENLCHANAFRYRDYVVQAFNTDKPFDRFVQEQIAGDLLPDDETAGNAFERIIATGFLVIGPKMLAEDDPVKLQMDIIDEQVDTIGRAFMGMTFGCARCHDHKFDPVSMADYYGLAGMFKSTHTMDSLNVVAQWHERPLATPDAVTARDEHQKKISHVAARIAAIKDDVTKSILSEARRHVGDYLLAAETERRRRLLKAQVRSIGKRPAAERPESVILIEAERFARGNVNGDTTGYGAGIGVLVNKGPTPNFVEYDINIPTAGHYQFEVRVAAESARPCQIAINGAVVDNSFAGAVTGSWYPDTQTWFVEGFYPLKAGKNVVRLEHAQFFPHIDKLLLAPAPDGFEQNLTPEQSGYELVPEFVTHLTDLLNTSGDVRESPFRLWLARTASSPDQASLRALADQYTKAANQGVAISGDSGQVKPKVLRELLDSDDGPFRSTDSLISRFPDQAQQELQQLGDEEKSLRNSLPAFPVAMAVEDVAEPADIRVHYRGNHLTQGAVAPRRFPRIMTRDNHAPIVPGQSGRLQLARWLTSPEHPLTARVIVNRVWHWHFGAGLVRSTDNFGQLGERPTHPELLDWLTLRFVESGWSLKALHRLILNSSTWQMSSRYSQQAGDVDPENRLIWHMPRRRLEAEEIRDSILAVARNLDRSMRGTMLNIENRKYVTSTANVAPVVYDTTRRSVYLPVVRSAVFEVLLAFDFADPGVSSGNRQSTTVAPQALFMMNSEIVATQTRAMAAQLLNDGAIDDRVRIVRLYRNCLSRVPTESEVTRALDYLAAWQSRVTAANAKATASVRLQAWQSLARVLIASNEFVFVE